MARRADLDKIGKEGFDMMDEYDRTGRPPYRHHVDRRSQVPNKIKEEVVLDCNEAAKLFGGVVIGDDRKEAFDMLDEYDRRNGRPPYLHHVDRRSQVPQMKGVVVLDCYEAAKLYGGVVVRDGRKKAPFKWAF
ncbi:unnamed protein product [Ilex paraguariensis]|uniref:Uncharacterized protein n=1 Tax=Ilex paraguariensis TaxID=185542 RepID=A0ABC8R4I0_9AQUA